MQSKDQIFRISLTGHDSNINTDLYAQQCENSVEDGYNGFIIHHLMKRLTRCQWKGQMMNLCVVLEFSWTKAFRTFSFYLVSLEQDCSNSIATALQLLQSCTKSSILRTGSDYEYENILPVVSADSTGGLRLKSRITSNNHHLAIIIV